ncbi:MAG: response regulator [Deltaproteobacteria bacterium]|nr:response regulator [Deltaproteobacteria bacterium]
MSDEEKYFGLMEELPLLGLSILIVNEDLGNREAVSQLLEDWGAMVDRVEQGRDALEAISRFHYDTVMIDEDIACVDSAELTDVTRFKSKNKNTSVIISGSLMVTKDDAVHAGVDGYIQKPFDELELLESLLHSQKRH